MGKGSEVSDPGTHLQGPGRAPQNVIRFRVSALELGGPERTLSHYGLQEMISVSQLTARLDTGRE
jgi:hypothetical protein